MSGKRDSISRILGADERRKRRNLSAFPGIASGAGGDGDVGDPTSCPNIGPADAGPERCTIKGTGNPTNGVPYLDVSVGAAGMIAGQDLISYCYDARVGPGTDSIECWCDGKLGLIASGKVYDSGHGFNDDSWKEELTDLDSPFNIAWHRFQDENGFWWLKTDGLPQIPAELGGFDTYWYLYPKNMPDLEEMWVVAYIDGMGSEGCWYCNWWVIPLGCPGHRGHAGVMACKTDHNFNGWGGEDSHWHGFSGCGSGAEIYQYPARVAAGGGIQFFGLPSLWKQNSSSDANTVRFIDHRGSPTEHTTTNTNKDGQAGKVAIYQYLHTDVPVQVIEGGGFRLGWFTACTSREVKMQGLPTGYYAGITGFERAWPDLTTAFDGVEDGGESGGTVTIDFGGRHPPASTWIIWDGDPDTTGVEVLRCDIPRGIWGGDVFEYFALADCEGTEIIPDVEGYIKMEVIDATDTVRDTIIPTDVANTTEWVRHNGILGYGLPSYAHILRFTPVKTGTGDAFACFQKLQVNLDAICCAYTDPIGDCCVDETMIADFSTLVVAEGGEVEGTEQAGARFIAQLWDAERQVIVNASDVGAAVEEHRQGQQNIMGFDGDAERDGPGNGAVGNPSTGCGYEYDMIDMVEWGIEEGDPLSLRFKGKVV